MRKFLSTLALSAFLLGASAGGAFAAPLPDNCVREQGTVTCTTVEGPGRNQGGVGNVTTNETQGNTKNKSPEEQQDLEGPTCEQNPGSSRGKPIAC